MIIIHVIDRATQYVIWKNLNFMLDLFRLLQANCQIEKIIFTQRIRPIHPMIRKIHEINDLKPQTFTFE